MKVELTPHQRRFVAMKMKGGGYLSEGEVMREALRVYELVDQEDSDPELVEAVREALRSPRKAYEPGHFASLVRTTQLTPFCPFKGVL
jgi:putative addiction module CopG family antidote